MADLSELVYLTENGEKIPVTELVKTSNIQEAKTGWFKQDDIYVRHMGLSYLPNDVSIAATRALAHADGIGSFEATISNRPDETNSVETAQLATEMSMMNEKLKNKKIAEKARAKILSNLADKATEQMSESTVKASILFSIEAKSKNELERYTTEIKEKADELGVGVAKLKESPEAKIIAMTEGLPIPKEVKEEYCITIDAATVAIMTMREPPQELLDELYEEPKNPIYLW
jgi:hypothetical protein